MNDRKRRDKVLWILICWVSAVNPNMFISHLASEPIFQPEFFLFLYFIILVKSFHIYMYFNALDILHLHKIFE